jgi:hypothetical protein
MFIHAVKRENMLGRINRNAFKLHLGGPFVDREQLNFGTF